ncbi:lysine transporter LysE [Sphingomonas spermidinifaciens]|uniref:Lysine transporter LysE n=1 Tax=Sphingomonas spermidinifaciens TaxID=1141889 RepID=A0A2A4B8L5_9SPHN|nr:LysE family translocator [Sphingomonas spermidinifaciens]PCD04004.1 lysine transporter LysE [Sphingomonas spermidinifaciens]
MELQAWLPFAVVALLLAVLPGPGVASIVGFAFSSGRRAALASVAGMATGNLMAVSASLAGAGALIATSPAAFAAFKWAGAAYLVVIGLLAIARSGRGGPVEAMPRRASPRAAFMTNVAVGGLHPKTILFFVAFASQFVRPDRPYLPQALVLGATFVLTALVTDTLYALGAARAAAIVRRPATQRWTQRISGGVIVTAGAALALAAR